RSAGTSHANRCAFFCRYGGLKTIAPSRSTNRGLDTDETYPIGRVRQPRRAWVGQQTDTPQQLSALHQEHEPHACSITELPYRDHPENFTDGAVFDIVAGTWTAATAG